MQKNLNIRLRAQACATLCLAFMLSLGMLLNASVSSASDASIKAQLEAVGKKLVQQAAKNILPHQNNKAVTQEGSAFAARYVDVAEESLVTEMHQAQGNDRVGTIKYTEVHYVCRGATKAAALKAPCTVEKRRNMTEIVAYTKGKWLYH